MTGTVDRPRRRRRLGLATAKEAAGALVRWTGAGAVVRRVVGRRRAGILVYHDPTPAVLGSHLRWLFGRYSFVTLDLLVDAIRAGDWSGVPRNALAVTFDDGHAGNAALAGVLREHGVVPTIFLCSQIVGTARRFWWTLDGVGAASLKEQPDEERLAALAERAGYAPTAEYEGRPQALTRAEIAGLAADVRFGAHTRFHPILPMCGDRVARDEILLSKREVEELAGAECRHFAFPNGDFTARDLDLVREAGYRSSRTTRTGWNGVGSDPYRLRAIGIADDASVNVLALQLTGVRALLEGARLSARRLRARRSAAQAPAAGGSGGRDAGRAPELPAGRL